MLKNFKKLLNLIITENIFKYTTEKYKEHIKKFPNIAYLAFDVMGPHISLFGRFESNELKVLEEKVFNKIDCSNSSCLDVGAHIGNHSVFFANFFSSVDCFEPQPDNYYLLKFNTKKFQNIRTFNFGSSDIDEHQYLYTPNPTDTGFSTIYGTELESANEKNMENHMNNSKIKVELKNLDNFYKENKIKKISFIKIDVEGHEYKSLMGLKNTITSDSPIIALEQFVGQFGQIKKTTQTIDFLKKNLYNFFYEPVFFKRKKNKNKILRAFNKIIFYLQILFDKGKINFYSLEKIDKFNVKSYPMIIASKFDLNN